MIDTDRPEDGQTDPGLVATAYFARSTDVLAQTAAALGKADDATRYQTLREEITDAFGRHYLRDGGRLVSDSATAYALSLAFNLVADEDVVSKAGWSPFAGRTLVGRTVRTYVRGTLAMDEGDVLAEPCRGRFLRRNARQVTQ